MGKALASWVRVVALCALLVPGIILWHESGHFVAAKLFGFPGPSLHYAYTNHGFGQVVSDLVTAQDLTGLERHAPLWQLAVLSAAGPGFVLLGSAACFFFLCRHYSQVLFLLGASLAWAQIRMPVLLMLSPLEPRAVNVDEVGLSTFAGIPQRLVAGVELAVLVLLLCLFGRQVPKGQRWQTWTALVVGSALGRILWLQVLGPRLLP